MFFVTKILGNFDVTAMRLVDGHVLHFTVRDPNPEQHKHENSMIAAGSMQIATGEYSTTVSAGQSAKFTPRAGQTPFDPGLVSTLTAVGLTTYVCVKETTGKTLTYEAQTVGGATPLVAGTLVVPVGDCTLNGEQKVVGDLILAAEGDMLDAPAGTQIGVFIPI